MIDLTTSGIDYAQACALPWTQARDLRAAVLRARSAHLLTHAVACRAAQLPADAWQRWLTTLEEHPDARGTQAPL